jgi:hypothetical protein
MQYMHIILLSDFLQALNSARKLLTKNYYFSKHILFTIVYLLQEQKLNPRNYSKPKRVIRFFLQSTEYDVHMYAKFECLDFYEFL